MKINSNDIMLLYLMRNNNPADSGLVNKAFECGVRSYISRKPVYTVKSQGKTDITFTLDGKRYTCEIKTACGEVETAEKNQYIIYCPLVDLSQLAETQAFVFTREEWKAFLNGYTGRGKFLRYDAKRGHYHIQSFYGSETVRPKASKPIANYIWECCYNQPTLAEFLSR